MKITAINTPLIKPNQDLFAFIKDNVKKINERSVLVVTSKIISYSQGRFVAKKTGDTEKKLALVKQEADFYIDQNISTWDVMITIKDNVLAINAGIDESNSVDGDYVLWPKDLQATTTKIWKFLKKEYQLKEVGVVVTDSKTFPLRWGMVGTAIAYCGFKQLNDKRTDKDLFNREMKVTQVNVAEPIAVAAVLEMGEVDEAKPLAVVEDIGPIEFQDELSLQAELKELKISLDEDLYAPILKGADWKKGGGGI
jgi:dihydrofolate synthase / folylpolyglutamate synthase